MKSELVDFIIRPLILWAIRLDVRMGDLERLQFLTGRLNLDERRKFAHVYFKPGSVVNLGGGEQEERGRQRTRGEGRGGEEKRGEGRGGSSRGRGESGRD